MYGYWEEFASVLKSIVISLVLDTFSCRLHHHSILQSHQQLDHDTFKFFQSFEDSDQFSPPRVCFSDVLTVDRNSVSTTITYFRVLGKRSIELS